MKKQPDRLDALAELCKQKLLADPNYPWAAQLKRALELYENAKKLGEEMGKHGSTTPPSTGNRSA